LLTSISAQPWHFLLNLSPSEFYTRLLVVCVGFVPSLALSLAEFVLQVLCILSTMLALLCP